MCAYVELQKKLIYMLFFIFKFYTIQNNFLIIYT